MTLLQLIKFKIAAHRLAALLEQRRRRVEPLRRGYAARHSGFTMIELLITLVIVGILAAVAQAAYASATGKAASSEAVRMLDGAEVGVVESYMTTGVAPGNAGEAGVQQGAGKYVASVNVGTGGAIWATFLPTAPNGLANTTLQLTPYLTGADPSSPIAWVCGNATPQAGWVPLPPGTINAPPGTTVPANLITKTCRAGG